ncbi:RagB/SusD family nutrient uptake outer membrane protein [Allomuricauda sp. F6463D]|uniref:RagB/SusD family nutrient uptake outer membrane protein n=1 Tax=Allomuricauda sp. F6463D TaxID=2926409 RepID=UPI001FF0E8D1|nr:RagB/SusD family nutrient uptake outer membrane protein [Muricauda sp. F6463D]MCK0159059.1 RagB/SusD family nutrient uptake outer membrane protein [Muricauda sp. F6463D]
MIIKRTFIVISALLLCIACESELDQLPETGILADNYYTDQDNVESTVNATYNELQALYDYYMILWGEIPTDNAYIQAPNSNGGARALEDFSWTSTDGFVGSIWENCYEGIFYANTVLDIIDEVLYDSESLKSVRIGEMKFIRGFLYDHLTTMYGAVPLVLTIDDPTNAFDDTRTSVEEIYEQIENDLLDAIDLLPKNNSTGRANEYAARAILAKHYMKRQLFGQAEDQLEIIVDSQQYELAPIDELFGVENEGNDEDIFSVQYASDLDGRSEGSRFHYLFTQPDDQGGMGAMAMESSLYDLYETDDLRRDFINESNNVYYLDKWTPSPSSDRSDGGDNHYVVRYADILLLYAECLNENDKTPLAGTYLDLVRDRANLEGTTATDKASMRSAIALERRLELVGEGHRWVDLLRTGSAISTMNTFFQNENKSITVEPIRLLSPLPQAEVDITEMEQNPGY